MKSILAFVILILLTAGCLPQSPATPPTVTLPTVTLPTVTLPTVVLSTVAPKSEDQLITEYTSAVIAISGDMTDNLVELTQTLDQQRLGDPAWMASLQRTVDDMNRLYLDVQLLQPPPSLEPSHVMFVAGTSDMIDGANLMMESLTEMDAEKMTRAVALIQGAAIKINMAAELVPD